MGMADTPTPEEARISEAAIAFSKKHKKAIAKRLTDPNVYPPEEEPVSVFMAGSPGAGKTEASIALLEALAADGPNILRIDPDELRYELPGYDGSNSWLFHSAVSLLVEKIHDLALDHRQSFVLDGTLASYDVAEKNIRRSLKRERSVQILYVYQAPLQAWEFVLAREERRGTQNQASGFHQAVLCRPGKRQQDQKALQESGQRGSFDQEQRRLSKGLQSQYRPD